MLCINKPAGLLSQGDRTGDIDVLSLAREYVRVAANKPGEAFVATVHRLDRPGEIENGTSIKLVTLGVLAEPCLPSLVRWIFVLARDVLNGLFFQLVRVVWDAVVDTLGFATSCSLRPRFWRNKTRPLWERMRKPALRYYISVPAYSVCLRRL